MNVINGVQEQTSTQDIVLLSRKDVCQLLRIGSHKVSELFHRDDFPAIKVGRQYWVAQDSLKQYLSSRKIIG